MTIIKKKANQDESLSSLFENQNEAWIIFDAEKLIAIRANQKALNLFGLYRVRNLSQLSFKNIFREPLSDEEVQLLYTAIDQETFINRSLQCSGLSGRTFKAAVSINRVYDGNLFCRFNEFPIRFEIGKPALPPFQQVAENIQDQQQNIPLKSFEEQNEQTIPNKEETIINDEATGTTNFPLIWLNEEQLFVKFNSAFVNLTGYNAEELMVLHFNDITNPLSQSPGHQKLEELTKGNIIYFADERTLLRKNSEKIFVRCEGMMTKHKGIALLKMEDITVQKSMERDLIYTRDNLSAVVEHTEEAIFSVDALDKITVLNKVYRDRFFERYGVWLKNGMFYADALPKNERATWRSTLTDVLRGKIITSREQHSSLEGKLVNLEVSLHPVYSGVNKLITGLSYFARNITAQMEYENELRKAKEIAEKATESKSRFLATMSHEIRTPLNGIIGMAELMRTTKLNDEQQNLLSKIRVSGDALLQVINEVLDFSQIEADKMQLEAKPFSVEQLIREAIDIVYIKSQEKGLDLIPAIHPQVPKAVVGDKARLRQVLVNLLGNAIKFTAKGSVRVEVSDGKLNYEPLSVQLKFSVKDTGIGIKPEQLERLFAEYSQADNSTFERYGGTGLGLTISKRIVELMGGKFHVESEYGKGSTFSFTIKVPVATTYVDEKEKNNFNDDLHLALNYPMNILVAEDNEVNQLLIVNILKQIGYNADAASNGRDVLQRLLTRKYDLIFMDVQMPRMDGLETTREIIELYNDQRPVIVAMTGFAADSDKQKCLDAGMDDYISKPILIEEINRMIKKWSNQLSSEKVISASANSNETKLNGDTTTVNNLISHLIILDSSAIKRLRDIAAKTDAAFVNQVISLFERQVPAGIAEIDEALNLGDLKRMSLTAHKLKGTCMNIGAKQLTELFRNIEIKGGNGDMQLLKAHVQLLQPTYEKTLDAFRKELSGGNK